MFPLCFTTRSASRRRASNHAFTLVELLVVIGIISVLISILLPSLNKARRQAQAVQCLSNLRQIGMLMSQYAAESKGVLPCTMAFGGSTGWAAQGYAEGGYPIWDSLLRKLDKGLPYDKALYKQSDKVYLCPSQFYTWEGASHKDRSYSANSWLMEGKWVKYGGFRKPDTCIMLIDSAVADLANYPYSVLKNEYIAAEWGGKYQQIFKNSHGGYPNILYGDLHAARGPGKFADIVSYSIWVPDFKDSGYVNMP
jgi:prepilin-type N-terminal cleavage/methylation domain-containing protein/prepilin-type processing-associated H-X9-DG protein